MYLSIFVKAVEDGFIACVFGLPGCTSVAPTRDEAIEKARLEALDWFINGEIVQVEVDDANWSSKEDSYSQAADDAYNSFIEKIRQYQRRLRANKN